MSGCFDRPSTQGGAKPRPENSAEGRSTRRNGRVGLSSNLSNPFLFAISDPRIHECFFIAFALTGLDCGQYGPEPLVGHDGSLCDSPLLLEDGEGQTAAFVSKFDPTIEVFVNSTASATEFECLGTWFDQITSALEVNRQLLRDLSIFLPAEDLLEILVLSNGAMGVVIAHRIFSESNVVGIDEGRGERVGGFDRVDAG